MQQNGYEIQPEINKCGNKNRITFKFKSRYRPTYIYITLRFHLVVFIAEINTSIVI